MDKYLEDIEHSFEEVDSSVYNYVIKAKFPSSNKFVNVTGLFNSPDELREVGLTPSYRNVIAKNRDGYEELRDLGFKDKEIIKQYGE